MRINNNMAAMNAWRNLSTNGSNMAKSLERLSSGYRINKAADDAAGLAVSEKMRAQVRGINMATRNTQDAVSMVQTAEGGASKIQDMLQRMRELAVQSGSDTLGAEDRAKLTEEFTALRDEIDRTAGTVTFNGRKLINGNSGDQASVTAGDEITNVKTTGSIKAAGNFTVSTTQVATEETYHSGTFNTKTAATAVTWNQTDSMDTLFGGTAFGAGDTVTFNQDGKSITIDMNAAKSLKAGEFINHVNAKAQEAGMAFRLKYAGDGAAAAGTGIQMESNIEGTYGDVTVNETIADADINFGFTAATNSQDALFTITDKTTNLAVATTDYDVKGNTLTGKAGSDLQGVSFDAAKAAGTDATLELQKNFVTFQVGANSGETIDASLGNLTVKNLGIESISIGDKGSSGTAMTKLDDALSTVSSERAKMGAMQNRLENAISTLQTQNENLTAAESRIRDLDMAAEMAQFTKHQVLQQASTSMLAQANQLSQGVLSLLQ